MSDLWTAVGIAIGGAAGAVLRYLIDSALASARPSRFPWGIVTVNITGSFAIGVLIGIALDHPLAMIATVGFLGGYTTLSTASVDTARLLAQRRYGAAIANSIGVLVVATGLAICGVLLGDALA